MQIFTRPQRATYILLLLLMIVSTASSQNGSKDKASANMYERAISACVAKQLKDYGGQGKETRLRLLNRIFLQDDFLTKDLRTQFGEITVSYLSSDELVARYQADLKTKKKPQSDEIPLTIIRPMTNEGTTLVIRLSDYWFRGKIRGKKSMVYYALEGGCHVSFRFDSSIADFVISETELWGI